MSPVFRFMMAAPWPMPRLGIRLIRAVGRRDPTRLVSAAGAIPGGNGAGDGRPRRRVGPGPAGQSLLLVVVGIARKPAVTGERIEPRDMLSLWSRSTTTWWTAPRRRGSCIG